MKPGTGHTARGFSFLRAPPRFSADSVVKIFPAAGTRANFPGGH